jgi:hypothetical protein
MIEYIHNQNNRRCPMRHIKECKLCGEEFSLHDPRKKRCGGKINQCPDCVEEHGLEIKSRVRAFTTGDGKRHLW